MVDIHGNFHPTSNIHPESFRETSNIFQLKMK